MAAEIIDIEPLQTAYDTSVTELSTANSNIIKWNSELTALVATMTSNRAMYDAAIAKLDALISSLPAPTPFNGVAATRANLDGQKQQLNIEFSKGETANWAKRDKYNSDLTSTKNSLKTLEGNITAAKKKLDDARRSNLSPKDLEDYAGVTTNAQAAAAKSKTITYVIIGIVVVVILIVVGYFIFKYAGKKAIPIS